MGAYGLRLPDLSDADELLVPAPSVWPAWGISHQRVRSEAGAADQEMLEMVTLDHARFRLLGGGWSHIERERRHTTLHLAQRPPDVEILHPYFGLSAAAAAVWDGGISFHAGAFVGGRGCWGLLAGKEGGKSSTLAALALGGAPIVSDDVLVVTDRGAFAGPRCIDLRTSAAEWFGVGQSLGTFGARDRWRLMTGAVAPQIPMRGWIVLSWGENLVIQPVEPKQRARLLARHLSIQVPPRDPSLLLDLASLPVWHVERPRRLDVLDEVIGRIGEIVQA